MQVIPDSEFRADIVSRIRNKEFNPERRIEPAHCTELISCLNKSAWRRLKEYEPTEQEILTFSLGWATQRWLTGSPADQPTIRRNDILVTPDELYTDSEGNRYPWELKCTYQSSNKAIEDNASWIRQIKAQCYVLGTTVAYLSRFELLADWSSIRNRKNPRNFPSFSAVRLEFSDAEIQQNWRWLRARRILWLHIRRNQIMLPKLIVLTPGCEYECKNCPFKQQCDESNEPFKPEQLTEQEQKDLDEFSQTIPDQQDALP